jgi:hypothetical protein
VLLRAECQSFGHVASQALVPRGILWIRSIHISLYHDAKNPRHRALPP